MIAKWNIDLLPQDKGFPLERFCCDAVNWGLEKYWTMTYNVWNTRYFKSLPKSITNLYELFWVLELDKQCLFPFLLGQQLKSFVEDRKQESNETSPARRMEHMISMIEHMITSNIRSIKDIEHTSFSKYFGRTSASL